jgi:L-iditol 2-dehydrogenase
LFPLKVLRLHQKGQLKLHDESEPTPAENEDLVRVIAVGICGSDLHWYETAAIGDARLQKPLVLGHEFAGILIDSGRQVAVDPAVACRQCRFCLDGNPNFCENLRFAGHDTEDGALREKLSWPKQCLHLLPDTMTALEGVMLEPLGVALHAFDLGRVRPGMTVGVFGCGPIGLMLIQLARLCGASRIVATDLMAHRLDAAREMGASTALSASDGLEEKEVWAATERRGIDLAFEAAGENQALQTAIQACRPGGQVVLIGIPPDDRTSFNASSARRKGLTIKIVRRMKHTYPRAIALVAEKHIDVRSLVTHCYSLSEFSAAFDVAARREGIKVIIEP